MNNTYSVFYFEDDEAVANPIKVFLEKPVHGPALEVIYHTDATSAKDAIETWSHSNPPNIALLDRHQDGYTNAGYDICKKIKAKWPRTPVVMLSGYDEITVRIDFTEIGVSEYLPKTILQHPDHREYIQKVLLNHIDLTEGDRPFWNSSNYMNGSLQVDMETPALWWRKKEVKLSPDNIAIVHDLADPDKKGKTRSYENLGLAGDLTGDEEVLRVNLRQRIQNIRQAFQAVDDKFIQACTNKRHGIIAVPKRGYYWRSDGANEDQ